MLKVLYKYGTKSFELSPYCTAQEKDLLLLETVGDGTLEIALEIAGADKDTIETLSHDEKIAMLYKLREISVGSEVNVNFKCKHCKSNNENYINIEDLVLENGPIENPMITDRYKVLTDDNIGDFLNCDIDELELDEYQTLYDETKNSITKFDFKKPVCCQKCSATNYIKINDPSFVLSVMSEDSLISIYQTYNDLNYFGSYSKADIDSFYPFERTIFISLLNKSRENNS